jgi:hypothetical protein
MNGFRSRRLAAASVLGSAVLFGTACSPAFAAPAQSASVARSAAVSGSHTFIAEGQYLGGTPLHEPACRGFGCQLSGDSTAYLVNMKWSAWTSKHAVGTGTYKVNLCTPNCATGKFYPVKVIVTFTQSVKACFGKSVRWYWTRATFKYPNGLPKALQGSNAPQNPWNFTELAASARQSCR